MSFQVLQVEDEMARRGISWTNSARAVLGLIFFGLALGFATTSQPARAQLAGGEVHGSIFALIRGDKSFPQIEAFAPETTVLPDVDVYLENASTSAKSPVVRTDLNGVFRFPSQPEAVYHLCWKARGFIAGCHNENFTLRASNIYLLPVGIVAQPGVVRGAVTLSDGASCRVVAGFLGADYTATVTAMQPGGLRQTARVNNFNDYVLGGIPAGTTQLVAACEKIETSKSVVVSGGSSTQNLVLPNTAPAVGAFYARAGGIVASAFAPGTTVTATLAAKPGTAGFHFTIAGT
jgi:hypothetical protein